MRTVQLDVPLHGLPPNVIEMIRGELQAARVALDNILQGDDSRRIAAVMVLLDEVFPEFEGHGRKPWRAVPWLDCAAQLLQRCSGRTTSGAREHISAARDLLSRE
jgi:hypothetical protein